MRIEARIDVFCRLLAEKWKEQCVDLRFTQFMLNNGIQISSNGRDLFYMEEPEFLKAFFPDIDPAEYLFWGTYGEDGKQPIKWILIADMETSHIKAILSDNKKKKVPVSDMYLNIFKKVLKDRKKFEKQVIRDFEKNIKNSKKTESDTHHIIEALKNMPDKKTHEKYIKKVDKKKKSSIFVM